MKKVFAFDIWIKRGFAVHVKKLNIKNVLWKLSVFTYQYIDLHKYKDFGLHIFFLP